MNNVANYLIIGLALLGGLASLAGGIACLVMYARTRKIWLLVVGLLLSLVIPGIAVCLALASVPNALMVPYGPPPDLAP